MSLQESRLSHADASGDAPAGGLVTPSRPAVYLAGTAALFVMWLAWLIRDFQMDDAYIGFQYLKSLLDGHGFVFAPGATPVEGVTNIGWQVILAPVAVFAGPLVAAKVVGLVLVLIALRMVAHIGLAIAERCGPVPGRAGLWLVPVLLTATSFDFLYFSLAGMETALLGVLLLAMALAADRAPNAWALPALGAAAYLVHPEAILVVPLYAAIAIVGAVGDRRRHAMSLAILAGLVLGITALRYGYFGDIVPNTFHAKSGGLVIKIDGAFKFLAGRNVNIGFPIAGAVALPFLALGYLHIRRTSPALAAMLAAVATTGIAFGIYSRPDWTGHGRYFAPYLPGTLVLLWCGLSDVIARLAMPQNLKRTRRILGIAAAALVCTQLYGVAAGLALTQTFPGYVLAGRSLVAPAEWMRDNLPGGTTIATRRIGALAYLSEHRVFDYVYGLTERDIAALVSARGRRFDATDDDLAAAWGQRSPDYILEDDDIIDEIVRAAGGSPEHFVVHGIAYKVLKRFPIGRDRDWVLAGRHDLP